MNDERNEALVAAGGLATGSILGGILGGNRAKKKLEKKIAKTEGRREIAAAKRNLKAVEEYKRTGDASGLSKKIENLAKADSRGKKRLEFLAKKAAKLGKRKGAIIGAGAGLLSGLAGYEYLTNKNRDGYN